MPDPAWFRPILAGAHWPDRLIACLGALIGIALAAAISAAFVPMATGLPMLVAPIGASAVLLFAVPASPLAQPWPIVGGNTVSALVGVTAHRFLPDPALAAGVAVGGAILAMSLLRCLHPPGGAAALTAVVGGPAIAALGYGFALVPVASGSVLLLLAGLLFHALAGRRYPHRPPPPVPTPTGLERADIDAALAATGESFDINRADLDRLLQNAERHAEARRRG